MKRIGAWLSVLAVCMAAAPATGYQVIGREAGAVPVQQAIGDLLARYSEPDPDSTVPETRPAEHSWPRVALPLESVLSPRAGLRSVRLETGLTTPVCLIGSDEISRAWLQANRDRLAELGARCVLVQARTESDVENMVRIAHPVPVAALPFDDIVQLHDIPGYPVLLTGAAP